METLLTSKPITAQRAVELSLVTRVVPQVDLLGAALELAERICTTRPCPSRRTSASRAASSTGA